MRHLKEQNLTIGKIIADYRKISNETQETLARAIGKERNTVSQYEHGRVNVPPHILDTISKRYSIPPGKLGLSKFSNYRSKLESLGIDLALEVLRNESTEEMKTLALQIISLGLEVSSEKAHSERIENRPLPNHSNPNE